MYRLHLLGGASLTDASGPVSGRVGHRHRLALLALLAGAGEAGCSRDILVAYLWPESDTAQARHRLSDSLYMLRQTLGEDAVVVASEHVWLNRERVWVDANAFQEALEGGNREEAVRLYGGRFLDGFHLGGSRGFEEWLEAERARLAELHCGALRSLARQAEEAGDPARAAEWWKQLVAADPYNSRVTVSLMEALVAAGDPANAIQQAAAHERRLRDELGVKPAPEVRALVARLCGEPAAAERNENASTPRVALEDSTADTPVAASAPAVVGKRRSRKLLAAGLVAVAVTVTLAGVWRWLAPAGTGADRPVVEFYMDPPDSTMSFVGLALSPDGRRLVGVVAADTKTMLYERVLEARDWRVIPGTEGAYGPFFSPDGKWLGFVSGRDGTIRRVPAEGGAAQTIVRVDREVEGATWGPDSTIVFSMSEAATGNKRQSLYRVSVGGGVPERLTTPDEALREVGHIDPCYLPSGRAVLFTAINALLQPIVAALSLESGTISRTIPGMKPLGVGAGRVVFVRPGGTAVVQTLDPRTLALDGSPRPIAEGIATAGGITASYTISADGSLAYLSASADRDELLLVSRRGETRSLFSSVAGSRLGLPRSSPSGDRIAFVQDTAVWVYSLAHGTAQRLSFEGPSADPAWTRDGRAIAYSVAGRGAGAFASLYLRAADGTGAAQEILAGDRDVYQAVFAPGDSEVVFFSDHTVFRASLSSDSEAMPLMATESFIEHPALSPNGRWLAYTSNESGIDEVYVRSYPDMGPPTVVSTGGGRASAWSGDGSEVFFWAPGWMVAASVRSDGVRADVVRRTRLFRTDPFQRQYNRNYDVHPNDREFVMVGRPPSRAVVRLNALAAEP